MFYQAPTNGDRVITPMTCERPRTQDINQFKDKQESS